MSYLSTVLADSPENHHLTDEASGITWADSSGHGRTGSYSGSGITYQQSSPIVGTGQYSALLDGSAGVLTSATLAGVITTACTVECWFKTSDNSNDRRLVHFNNASAKGPISFNGSGLGAGALCIYDGSAWQDLCAAGTISNSVWYHMCLTMDGTNATLYINAVAKNTKACQIDVSNTVRWGAKYLDLYGAFYSGYLTQCAVYSAALSSARITAHYNAGLALPGGNFYYRLLAGAA